MKPQNAAEYRESVWGAERCSFDRIDEGHYSFVIQDLGLEVVVDRLRRRSGELHGELSVRSSLPGARTFEGVVSVASINLSSTRARQERAKYLANRTRDDETDWVGLLEEFSQRVLGAERAGQPAVLLRDIPRPKPDDVLHVDGFPLPRRHGTLVFGDGGAAKSLLALYIGGRLDRDGHRVGFFDWELAGEDHRERLERLFPGDLPGIFYARCSRPFAVEIDRLRRIVRDEQLDFVICDSIAFACDGPPEAAEVAGRYFQALRSLGPVGSLHVAHVSKSEGADRRPFGSTFWHNGARATWYCKATEDTGSDRLSIALLNRKANLGPLQHPLGFEITFGEHQTSFRPVDVADVPDLAGQLSIRQRMRHLLRRGGLSVAEIAEELGAPADSVKKAVQRDRGKVFTRLPGADGGHLIGLLGGAS